MALSSSSRYRAELPADIGPFKQFLQEYSHIPVEETDSHICKIRDQAYAIAPYPGFGLWGFTRIRLLEADPNYHLAVSRLVAPGSHDVLLDLGCGLGQNIRQLASAGVPPARLCASDLRPELMELGFELFRDRDVLGGEDEAAAVTFVAGDVLDPDEAVLSRLDGRVSIVHAANLFHLFGWDAQARIGIRVARMLRGGGAEEEEKKKAFVFGRQIGSLQPGAREVHESAAEEKYLHDQNSFQKLWDKVGKETGTRWRVEVEMLGKMPPGNQCEQED
ncbi:hypothetical protein M406DRAFT_342375 [Cryphonectria parasitica EP155]|uniref:Methyltransferase domain-containing protein n=1 Tax=Cryphonectria parasitica (strain ATCC 38755 / EP155) TaxID=660469 RepID=A0A9P4XV91_CRYP1|nr:uncharacterized protein M406DRAFT_342375 [Cryphonectria parasitica EP155]KAF3761609.1 hypothetical protein M406DRAFT_342375 [Cryphonectria parasitica EP155]